MLVRAYSYDDILEDIATWSNEQQMEIYAPAVNHCNLNPNAHSSMNLNLSGNDILKLNCKQSGLGANRVVAIDAAKGLATVDNKVATLKMWDDAYKILYMSDSFEYEIDIFINRDTAEFREDWMPFGSLDGIAKKMLDYKGICKVSKQKF